MSITPLNPSDLRIQIKPDTLEFTDTSELVQSPLSWIGQERAELVAKAENEAKIAKDNLEKYHRSNALNSALSMIHDDFKELSSAKLDSMIKIDYNEQGEALIKFINNGEVVASSVDEFKGWAAEQDSFKRIMNGVNSSGAGASNANGGANGANNENSAFKQRLKQAGLI